MLIAPVAQVVSSAIVLALASQSATNILQTVQFQKQLAENSELANPLLSLPPGENDESMSTADRLRSMNRKDLLCVFANSRSPTPQDLEKWFSCNESNASDTDDDSCWSEWDGTLLENNGGIMTAVSKFMSHFLFGGLALPWRLVGSPRKAKGWWYGKAFRSGGQGINRFLPPGSGEDSSSAATTTFRRHVFDYAIVESDLLPSGSMVLRHDYREHQSLPVSLWASMVDELRVVGDPGGDDAENPVLIGMGWMGWSGGALNCSPFLLERTARRPTKTSERSATSDSLRA